MRKALLVLATTLFAAFAAVSQTVYTPERGSAERKAILDALRIPIERELKQPIIFVADNFNVQGNWAFVGGMPQGADGNANRTDRSDHQRGAGVHQEGSWSRKRRRHPRLRRRGAVELPDQQRLSLDGRSGRIGRPRVAEAWGRSD